MRIVLGKLNMDEFAMGSRRKNSGFQSHETPGPDCIGRLKRRVRCGVAADECIAALGTDTGGSSVQLPHCAAWWG